MTSEYLTQWEEPDYYAGFSPDGDYVVLAQSAAGDLLEQVNFQCASNQLCIEPIGESFDDRPETYTFRASHFACGWIEYLMVRRDASAKVIDVAEEIVCALAEHPVLDDMAYFDAESEAVSVLWDEMDLRERIQLCEDCGESIMAARHPVEPGEVSMRLREWVNE